jgi:hypothetical protein
VLLLVPCLFAFLFLYRFISIMKVHSLSPMLISLLCTILDVSSTFYVSAIRNHPNFYETNPLFRFALESFIPGIGVAIISLYKFLVFTIIIHAFISSHAIKRRRIKRYTLSEIYGYYQGEDQRKIVQIIHDTGMFLFTGSVLRRVDSDYFSKARAYKKIIHQSYGFMLWLSLYIPICNILFLTENRSLIRFASVFTVITILGWLVFIKYLYSNYYKFCDSRNKPILLRM